MVSGAGRIVNNWILDKVAIPGVVPRMSKFIKISNLMEG